MSVTLDRQLAETGTRFRIYPQPRFLPSFRQPETIYVSVPPERIQAGPADDRIYTRDAPNKPVYDNTYPPYIGPALPPPRPGADGHYDKLDVNSREFSAAVMYATVRRVLDIWEDYFGHRIEWHFTSDYSRLELIPMVEWDNAQSGWGFLEFGYGRTLTGAIDRKRPYCQNFDVLAHELGHSIAFSQVGWPASDATSTAEYGGFQESAGDLVALVASLHSNKVVEHLLNKTRGNLFTASELERMGELSASREIRVALNYERMSTVTDEPHDLSQPLTGAIFDVLVEVFQKRLIARGLITRELAERSNHEWSNPGAPVDDARIQRDFDAAFKRKRAGFRTALLEARDYLGSVIAATWSLLSPDNLHYSGVIRAMLSADRAVSNGAHQDTIRSCFAWREISLPPGSPALRARSLVECGLLGGLPRVEDRRRRDAY